MTRLKGFVKFSRPVAGDASGLRLSTPEIVARYIASRLKCETIADLGCGIGGQTVFFARECEKVFAVELDRSRLEFARHNCRLYNVNNVVFVEGDALSPEVREKLRGVDVIFSDPARPLSEKTRRLENMTPPPLEVLEFYRGVTDRFAFQVPPFLSVEEIRNLCKVCHRDSGRVSSETARRAGTGEAKLQSRTPFECEREYISLGGQLNRLTLYLRGLARCKQSAVVLPGGARLCSNQELEPAVDGDVERFVYEPEPSITHAHLLGELCQTLGLKIYNSGLKRPLLTSKRLVSSPFFKDSYLVLETVERGKRADLGEIKKVLRRVGAGKAVLRLEVKPEDYWELRSELESGLSGKITVHVFSRGEEVVICQKLK